MRNLQLDKLHKICDSCTKCSLGNTTVSRDGHEYKPNIHGHYNTMSGVSDIMVVGQNPKIQDLENSQAFSGPIGKQFDEVLEEFGSKYCIDRNSFYFTYVAKCCGAVTSDHIAKCQNYLKAEIAIIKPAIVVTMGSMAFRTFRPDLHPADHLGRIIHSPQFNVKIYPTYDPSARDNPDLKQKFDRHMKLLCDMMFNRMCPW